MSAATRLDTILHRHRLGSRIAYLLANGGAIDLIRAAWRVFCRLARATATSPTAAFAEARK